MSFIQSLLTNPKAAVRSALTVALAVVAGLTLLSQYVSIPGQYVAYAAAVVAALKWLLSALDGKQTAYGRGATTTQ